MINQPQIRLGNLTRCTGGSAATSDTQGTRHIPGQKLFSFNKLFGTTRHGTPTIVATSGQSMDQFGGFAPIWADGHAIMGEVA